MKRITPVRLSLMAMFIALQVVLSKFLMLQAAPSVRLSIDSVPILLAGIWLGPVAGGVVGVLGDVLGTLLFPTAGAYYPPLTIAFLLIGVVSGSLATLVRGRNAVLRAVCCVLPAELIGSLIWKSYALSMLLGISFLTMMAARVLPVLCVAAADTLLVGVLDRLLGTRILYRADVASTDLDGGDSLRTEMSYDETLDYIHHVTWRGSRLGLERTRELLSRIGNPERRLRFIHVAGTNGKGSTSAMLERILRCAGYKTGLYTSPFINRFNERMQVNGDPIADDELAKLTSFIRPHADALPDHPTEFELITAIAMEYFSRHHVDIVVLEVGMGGALDSTNVIDTPELAIITRMGLDHTRELGPTMRDIAVAKAGIIKQGGDVLIYGQNPEADAVFEETCAAQRATLHVTDHTRIHSVSPALDALSFTFSPYGQLSCGLVGAYQAHNVALAITAVELLRGKGWSISDDALRLGLTSVRWPARFEILRRAPIFIADGGHNPQGVAAAVDSLQAHFPGKRITFLLGIMADKDIPHMLDLLTPLAKEFITVTPNNPRAISAEALAAMIGERGFAATACATIFEGVHTAIERAGEDGIVCTLGSLYMLGDVRAVLGVA